MTVICLCKFPNCQRAVYEDGRRTYDYCGRTHAMADHKRMQETRVSDSCHIDEDLAAAIRQSLEHHHEEEESLKIKIMRKRELVVAADEELARRLQEEEMVSSNNNSSKRHQIIDNEDPWKCSVCTVLNSIHVTVCEVCETPSNRTSFTSVTVLQGSAALKAPTSVEYVECVVESLQDFWKTKEENDAANFWNQKEETDLVASMLWTCLTCDTENSASLTKCPQCHEPKIVAAEQILWPCPNCTFDNSFADQRCFMCGEAIPPSQVTVNSNLLRSKCGMPGCKDAPSYYGFCSKSHFDRALDKHLLPPSERGIEAVLVGPTGDFSAHLLQSVHPKHESVKKQFLDTWLKTDQGIPRVERIFWIRMRPEILDTFGLMKLQLGTNVKRLFHGTSQSSTCFFGTSPSKPPCTDKNCRVCCIIRTSFDLSQAKRGAGGTAWKHQTTQLRYGEGMYFSPVSSKSNDYNNGSERTRPAKKGKVRKWKCMFLCNVALGRSYETEEGFLLRPDQWPPSGYDSVWGKTGPNLNYDEHCVYNVNQAIPSYLIVYSLAV